MSIITIASIALGFLILIGFLLGFWRSWKKSVIRTSLLVVSFLAALFLSPKIAETLVSKYVDGLVVSLFGQTIDIESIVGEIAGDLLTEGSALTTFATAILNILVKLIAFLIVFISFVIVTLIVYYIIVAIMAGRQRSRSVGKAIPRAWERLIGGFVGIVGSFVICLALFTPVFGIMNVCDKFLESNNKDTASAYNTSLIAGKFYTENKQIGQIEEYLEKYDNLRKEYKSSFAGIMLTYTGMDALGKATFNNLSTVTQNGMRVNFTDECVNMGNVYNIYKENFVKKRFDLANPDSVDAVQKMYSIVKNSEVMQSAFVELLPKMATKWTNGEKFLGMEIPVTGDMKEIVVEMLGVFKTNEFSVLDKNFNVALDAIRVANKHDVIKSVNGGVEILDVIDNGNFVEEEINTLAASSEYRRALPNILTTTVKLAYKSAIGEPGEKLNQEFTQEKIAEIVWESEAEISQTIVTNMFKFFDKKDAIDTLSDFGVVIDASRQSKILSKPVKTLMTDYINLKVTDLNASVKNVILTAFNDNWESETYSYENLFMTVQTTAKVAEDLENTKFTDIPLDKLLENDADGKVSDTVKQAIEAGVFKDLVGDEKKAGVYEDLIVGALDNQNNSPESTQQDLKAGQVVADIINKSNEETSMFGEDKNAEANTAVESLTSSGAVMGVLDAEANKVEQGQDSAVKDYIDGMNEADKEAFVNAINGMENGEDKTTLAKLFGLTIS